MIASNQALVDVLTRAYGAEYVAELLQRTFEPLKQLLARGRAAGVVRADVVAADFGPILEMLSAITGLGAPAAMHGLPHRYLGLILAGLRPGQDPLPGDRRPGTCCGRSRRPSTAEVGRPYLPQPGKPRHTLEKK